MAIEFEDTGNDKKRKWSVCLLACVGEHETQRQNSFVKIHSFVISNVSNKTTEMWPTVDIRRILKATWRSDGWGLAVAENGSSTSRLSSTAVCLIADGRLDRISSDRRDCISPLTKSLIDLVSSSDTHAHSHHVWSFRNWTAFFFLRPSLISWLHIVQQSYSQQKTPEFKSQTSQFREKKFHVNSLENILICFGIVVCVCVCVSLLKFRLKILHWDCWA